MEQLLSDLKNSSRMKDKFFLINSNPDGNCMFHSLLAYIKGVTPTHYLDTVKGMVVNGIVSSCMDDIGAFKMSFANSKHYNSMFAKQVYGNGWGDVELLHVACSYYEYNCFILLDVEGINIDHLYYDHNFKNTLLFALIGQHFYVCQYKLETPIIEDVKCTIKAILNLNGGVANYDKILKDFKIESKHFSMGWQDILREYNIPSLHILLNNVDGVICRDGLYYNESEYSKHVQEAVLGSKRRGGVEVVDAEYQSKNRFVKTVVPYVSNVVEGKEHIKNANTIIHDDIEEFVDISDQSNDHEENEGIFYVSYEQHCGGTQQFEFTKQSVDDMFNFIKDNMKNGNTPSTLYNEGSSKCHGLTIARILKTPERLCFDKLCRFISMQQTLFEEWVRETPVVLKSPPSKNKRAIQSVDDLARVSNIDLKIYQEAVDIRKKQTVEDDMDMDKIILGGLGFVKSKLSSFLFSSKEEKQVVPLVPASLDDSVEYIAKLKGDTNVIGMRTRCLGLVNSVLFGTPTLDDQCQTIPLTLGIDSGKVDVMKTRVSDRVIIDKPITSIVRNGTDEIQIEKPHLRADIDFFGLTKINNYANLDPTEQIVKPLKYESMVSSEEFIKYQSELLKRCDNIDVEIIGEVLNQVFMKKRSTDLIPVIMRYINNACSRYDWSRYTSIELYVIKTYICAEVMKVQPAEEMMEEMIRKKKNIEKISVLNDIVSNGVTVRKPFFSYIISYILNKPTSISFPGTSKN